MNSSECTLDARSLRRPARRRLHSRLVRACRRGRVLLAGAVWCVSMALGTQSAAAQVASEYEVKAAFLYNFAKFIEWPAHTFHAANEAFSICIIGDDPFGRMLDSTVNGKSVQDHPFAVRHLADAGDAAGCQILFLPSSETNQLRSILGASRGASLLIVGDAEDVVRGGGMIAFHMEGNRVRFMINRDTVERAGLQISSQLLKLADKVITSDSRQ